MSELEKVFGEEFAAQVHGLNTEYIYIHVHYRLRLK